MIKRKITGLVLTAVGLVSVGVVAACSGGRDDYTSTDFDLATVKYNAKVDSSSYINYDLSSNFVYMNDASYKIKDYTISKDVSSSNYFDTTYLAQGLLIQGSSNNKFYTLLKQENNKPYQINVDNSIESYKVTKSKYVGFFLTTLKNKKYKAYDGYGNYLGEYESEPTFSVTTKTSDDSSNTKSEILAVNAKDENGEVSNTYYEYNNDKTLTATTETAVKKDDKYEADVITIDLDELGLKGYYMQVNKNISSEYIDIYKDGGKLIKKIYIPSGSKTAFVDGAIIYQQKLEVSSNASEYDYQTSQGKFYLETYSIDLKTGKTKQLYVDYVIGNMTIYKTGESSYGYAFGDITVIKDKTLAETYEALINKSGEIIANVGGYKLSNFVKCGNSYYNTVTGELYNSSVSRVANIGSSAVYSKNEDLFMVKEGSYYGLISMEGNILVEPEYESIDLTSLSGSFIGLKENEYYILSKSGLVSTVDIKTVKYSSSGSLFGYDSDLNYKVINANGEEYEIASDFTTTTSKSTITTIYDNYTYYTFSDSSNNMQIVLI